MSALSVGTIWQPVCLPLCVIKHTSRTALWGFPEPIFNHLFPGLFHEKDLKIDSVIEIVTSLGHAAYIRRRGDNNSDSNIAIRYKQRITIII